MSLYSEDPEFKKAFDAYAKEVFEFIKKQCEDYMGKYISTLVEEEFKKMGHSEDETRL